MIFVVLNRMIDVWSNWQLRVSDRENAVDSSPTNIITEKKKKIDDFDDLQQSSEINLLSLSLSPI